MSESQRRRIFFLAGKSPPELSPAEHDELFRSLATWNATENPRTPEPRNRTHESQYQERRHYPG